MTTVHWLCPLHGSVDPITFWPPTPSDGRAVLRVTAFHATTQPFTFERVALGAPWVRTS